MKNIISFFIAGLLLGLVMIKSEAASWFRIYEMFQFQSFHMYGIIGSALVSAVILKQLIIKLNLKSFDGKPILFPPKDKGYKRYLFGGIVFGLGWALSGACPGPMFALLGAGFMPIVVVILSAIFGTFVYGLLRNKLPH